MNLYKRHTDTQENCVDHSQSINISNKMDQDGYDNRWLTHTGWHKDTRTWILLLFTEHVPVFHRRTFSLVFKYRKLPSCQTICDTTGGLCFRSFRNESYWETANAVLFLRGRTRLNNRQGSYISEILFNIEVDNKTWYFFHQINTLVQRKLGKFQGSSAMSHLRCTLVNYSSTFCEREIFQMILERFSLCSCVSLCQRCSELGR